MGQLVINGFTTSALDGSWHQDCYAVLGCGTSFASAPGGML